MPPPLAPGFLHLPGVPGRPQLHAPCRGRNLLANQSDAHSTPAPPRPLPVPVLYARSLHKALAPAEGDTDKRRPSAQVARRLLRAG
eukprot:scaffold117138_cov57-Phaeocystis_antarctica.AAC.1